ncbi:Uncharacterised protein [Klebsiella pneumoniae]|nr:Uncharacterised protein [Klebsiella pneumoniae]
MNMMISYQELVRTFLKEAKALINGGKYREIILNFDIDADDFFSLASHSAGTKISIADRNDRSPVESAK